MAVHNSMSYMVMLQRVEVAQTLPGLYCRTQMSK